MENGRSQCSSWLRHADHAETVQHRRNVHIQRQTISADLWAMVSRRLKVDRIWTICRDQRNVRSMGRREVQLSDMKSLHDRMTADGMDKNGKNSEIKQSCSMRKRREQVDARHDHGQLHWAESLPSSSLRTRCNERVDSSG